MATIHPYLNFSGNTEAAFEFYRSVFGGEFLDIQRFKDLPDGHDLSVDDQEKIMHIALPIGEGTILMGTDTLESMGQSLTVGNNYYISIDAGSKDEADELYHKLSPGGKIEMELQDTFWGAYFGMFADKYGVQWMINYDYNKDK